MEAKFGAKIDALQAEVRKNKADNVDASPPLLRRRELWSNKPRQLYINEVLDTGDAVTIYEAGPIKVQVGCGNITNSICDRQNPDGEVCMNLILFDANKDILVFGDINDDFGLNDSPIGDTTENVLDANVTYTDEMWDVPDSGNDVSDGAVWADGYYLGWDGDSFIGIQKDDGLLGGGNCQVAGVFNYYIPSPMN